MKIISLEAENFRRLKAVSIKPDGSVIQITGENGNGKTSVLNSIWVAMKGRAVCGAEPIRKGEETARIKLDLGDLIITRTFTRAKGSEFTTALKIVRADGSAIPKSPQAVLDALCGDMSFDPEAFSRVARDEPKKAYQTLCKLVPGFDFEKNAEQRRTLFEARTDINRDAKRAQAAAQAIVLPASQKPPTVDLQAALARMKHVSDHNTEVERIRGARDSIKAEIDRKVEEAETLRTKADDIDLEVIALESRLDNVESIQPKEPQSIDEAKAAVDACTKAETIIRAFEERERHQTEAKKLSDESDELTERINALDRRKAKAIEDAKLPVEGLAIGDGVVMLNGLPFSEASDAEQLRASVAIAMTMNPTLRVIRVHNGSLLDKKSLGMIAAMAETRDYQIFVEQVRDDGDVGIFIVDGEVAAVDGETVK